MNSIIQVDSERQQNFRGFSFFDCYHKNSFKQPARATWIDGWKIEYMAIADPRTIQNTPIVIIGGAFQNFSSYKYCVEQFFESGPVILIDLPSMGANQQITNVDSDLSAGILELPDLSHMLGQWLDLMKIDRVDVVGISLGSVIASFFVEQRKELVRKIILMGVMQETRKSWRMLLEESLMLMKEQRMDEFGQAVILYLVNHAKLDKTRMSPTAKRLFFRQMSEFSKTEQERYEINCSRLLRLNHVPVPQIDTLVACGQYDSFTLPYENAQFALQCPQVQFAMITNADHVPQLQRRKETMSLFTTYLKGQSIEDLDGIMTLTHSQMKQMERRGEDRIKVSQPETILTHRYLSEITQVKVEDLNYFGVFFAVDDVSYVAQHPRDLALHLSDEEGDFQIECLIFDVSSQGVRALFKHGSFALADRLLRYIQRQ